MDSNTPFWPDGLPVPLLGHRRRVLSRASLSFMESGRARVRRQFDAPLVLLEVNWNFTEDQYDTFRTFFINQLEYGQNTFVMSLLSTPGVEGEHDVELAFFDGTYSFATSDNLSSITATLEVVADPAVPPTPPEPPADPGLLCELALPTLTGAGDKFDCYDEEDPLALTTQLIYGTGFAGAWIFRTNYIGVQSWDTIEEYAEDGSDLATLNGGVGWTNLFNTRGNHIGVQCIDNVETYDEGTPGTLDGGSGWPSAWVLHDF